MYLNVFFILKQEVIAALKYPEIPGDNYHELELPRSVSQSNTKKAALPPQNGNEESVS